MNWDQIKIFLLNFLKKRIVPLSFLTIAIVLWIIQHNEQIKYGNKIPGYVGWLRLISFFFLFLAPYLFLIKEKRYILANLVIIGPIVIIIESYCFFMLGSPEREFKDFAVYPLDENNPARHLGTVPPGNTKVHDRKENGDQLVFDVHYTIDDQIRRTTPGFDSTKSEYALFFGCSIAFGYGIEDHETMAYFYQDVANVNSYNYSYSGWGTNQMLARLQLNDLSEHVKEKNGAAYYIFFWDHIKRSIGSMDRYTEWVHLAPYFYLDGGEIKRDRTFKDGRYWTSKFYELFYNTSIAEYFEINFPTKLRSDHFNLVTEMILQSKKEYAEQFGNENFYVIILPEYDKIDPDLREEFNSFLEDKNIDYLDLSNFVEYGPEYHLVGDPHPNPGYNQMIMKEVYKRLKQ